VIDREPCEHEDVTKLLGPLTPELRAWMREQCSRDQSVCANGHEWTPENTVSKSGYRACRTCELATHSRYRDRKRTEAA